MGKVVPLRKVVCRNVRIFYLFNLYLRTFSCRVCSFKEKCTHVARQLSCQLSDLILGRNVQGVERVKCVIAWLNQLVISFCWRNKSSVLSVLETSIQIECNMGAHKILYILCCSFKRLVVWW